MPAPGPPRKAPSPAIGGGLPPDAPGFEDALARLEAIVRRLEGAEVPLEQSLRDFEEGVKLARLCTAHLDDAERKVSLLIADGDQIAEVDLETGATVSSRPRPVAAPDVEEDLP